MSTFSFTSLCVDRNNELTFFNIQYTPPQTEDPAQLVAARHAVLAKIPLPVNPPDDTLSAILIPPPFTLHEFINAAPVVRRLLAFENQTKLT